jgi:hypothetical protein
MANLTQLLQFGRGLIQLPDATVEVLPDGTTLTFNTSNQLYIPEGAITTDKIVDGAITTAKIGNSQITTDKIADNQITRAKMTNSGKAIIDIRLYQNIDHEVDVYNAPLLLGGWTLLRVNLMTMNWTGDVNNYWSLHFFSKDTSGNVTDIGYITYIPSTTNPSWSPSILANYTPSNDCILYIHFIKEGDPSPFTGYLLYVICPTDTVYKY